MGDPKIKKDKTSKPRKKSLNRPDPLKEALERIKPLEDSDMGSSGLGGLGPNASFSITGDIQTDPPGDE